MRRTPLVSQVAQLLRPWLGRPWSLGRSKSGKVQLGMCRFIPNLNVTWREVSTAVKCTQNAHSWIDLRFWTAFYLVMYNLPSSQSCDRAQECCKSSADSTNSRAWPAQIWYHRVIPHKRNQIQIQHQFGLVASQDNYILSYGKDRTIKAVLWCFSHPSIGICEQGLVHLFRIVVHHLRETSQAWIPEDDHRMWRALLSLTLTNGQ